MNSASIGNQFVLKARNSTSTCLEAGYCPPASFQLNFMPRLGGGLVRRHQPDKSGF
jgi:hypothetical protein